MIRRAFRFFGRGRVAREVDDELAFHLEMRTRTLMAAGLTETDARREAERQFGDLDGVRRSCVTMDQKRERAMRRADWLDELAHDVVYAFRMLRRNPGFAAVVILTLAVGIGANTAIFTLVDAVVLRPLPVRHAEQLVAIGDPARVGGMSRGSQRGDLISYPMYVDLRDHNDLVTGLLASGRTPRLDVAYDAAIEHPRGRFVSGNFFSLLGITAAAGRLFDGSEDRAIGASPVIVISHGYWTRRFHADPGAIGRSLSINGAGFTIIGVAEAGFAGEIIGRLNDVWIPVTMQAVVQPHQAMLADRASSFMLLLGRLKPGVSLAQAEAGFTGLMRQIIIDNTPGGPAVVHATEQQVNYFVGSGARGFSSVRSTYSTPLYTLLGGVGLLLLIICGNVANLLLARAVARSREMSVRMAIGARRSRLVRQLLTESLLLAGCGAAAGLALAWWGSRLLLTLAADGGAAIPLDLRLGLPVLGFTAGLSVLAVALFGLLPALRASRVDLASTMRAHARAVTGSFGSRGQRAPLGKLLIAGQVALSMVLLMGAALLVRSLLAVQSADPGLDRDHPLIVEVGAIDRGYAGDRLYALARELNGRFVRAPGVAASTYSENGIFSGTESSNSFQIPGFTPRTVSDSNAVSDQVGPGYVHAIGARLLQGREFTEADGAHGAPVVMVNETMAKHFWPGASAIGGTMRFNDTINAQVVGVVADVKDHSLSGEPIPRFYVPYEQPTVGGVGSLRFEVRTTGDPETATNAIRNEIRAVDSQLMLDAVNPLSLMMRQSIREERLVTRLAAAFGVLALLLAAIGLYGVMTYAITRRTGEIGLRVALGAQQGAVLRMVLGDALRLVGLGLAIGIPLALAATRLIQGQLHGVSSADPAAIGVALVVLTASATLAALLPALRASRVEPLVALRQE